MPCRLATPATGSRSASRMIATICSSVKRALRIAPSESGASLSRKVSHVISGPKSREQVTPKPGRSQTSTGQTSGSDLGRLDLQELTGARDRNLPGPQRLWDFAHEVDVQKPILQARALNLDMVGELEDTFEVPRGDALVE